VEIVILIGDFSLRRISTGGHCHLHIISRSICVHHWLWLSLWELSSLLLLRVHPTCYVPKTPTIMSFVGISQGHFFSSCLKIDNLETTGSRPQKFAQSISIVRSLRLWRITLLSGFRYKTLPYLLKTKNKGSSNNGESAKNEIILRHPVVFRQEYCMLIQQGKEKHSNKPSHCCF